MKTHTTTFKEKIKELGRQQDVQIIQTINGTDSVIATSEEINSITPHFEASLLKSVMKCLEIDTEVNIAVGTEIRFMYGLLVVPVTESYEQLDYGNYIVYSCEKQEDTSSYKIICYDKLLYSMKDYEHVEITYPCTIKQYLTALCTKIGLTFKDSDFANADRQITNELFLTSNADGTYGSMGYTYRDVLDQIAEVTGGCICMTLDDKVEVRYINNTDDTIDEEYINDVNVNFGEKYGPINSIVLARAGESDKIYIQDVTSVTNNGLCELLISENQFMNFNDRRDYLQELSDKLFGVEYYLNDFVSTGIMYYDLLDSYNVKIGENTYNCLMLNDEQDITQGLEENIHTDMPEKSETDYKKADTTDRRINQTYLIVDKQNQKIEGVINQIGDRTDKTTTITADIDGLNSKVSTIADLTNETSGTQIVTLENCAEGEVVELHIYGNNTVFDYQYFSDDLYLSDNLILGKDESILIVTDEKGNENEYNLGITEVLRQNGDKRDEYVLKDGKAKVIRRLYADGSIRTYEEIEDLGELHISLIKGMNRIAIKDYNANIYVKWAIQNEYTDIFATRGEMSSNITQTAQQITFEVTKKFENYSTTTEMTSMITQTAESINTEVKKKVNESELGTKISQDWQSVQIAWNSISEYIKYINAQMQILDNNNNLLMALDSYGQNFYNNNVLIGRTGTNHLTNYPNIRTIDFNLDVEGSAMVWASLKTSTETEYLWKWAYSKGGVPNAEKEGLYAGTDIFMNGYTFVLYDGVEFSFNNLTLDTGNDFNIWWGSGSSSISIQSGGNLSCTGNVYAKNISSDGRLKKNIKESTINASEIIKNIKIRDFDWKDTGKNIQAGFIAQELEKVDSNFVLKKPIKNQNTGEIIDEEYYVNELPIIATLVKSMQEQQQEIEKLNEKISNYDFIIEKILSKLDIDTTLKDMFNTLSVKKKKTISTDEIIQDYGELKKEIKKENFVSELQETREKEGSKLEIIKRRRKK